MRRVIRQATIELARFGHVMEHEHAAGHGAGAVTNRRRGALHVQLVAVAADQQHGAHGLHRAGAADRHAQRILERLAGFFVEGAVDLFDGPAHRVFQPPARQLLGHGIDVVDRGVRVGRDHAVTDGLQRDLRALLLAEQRFFVELAFGDVELDTDQAQQAPMFIHARLGAAHHPAPVTVAVLHAMDGFENRRLARDVIADRALHARHVFRVHEAAPVGRIEFRVRRVAQHLLPARREMDFVALDVEVPETVVGGALRQLQALFQLAQAAFDAQPLQARGQRVAEQLEQQLQVHVPRAARQRVGQAQDAGRLAADADGNEQHRADLQFGEALALDQLVLRGSRAVADLGEAQMVEAALEPGIGIERGRLRQASTRHWASAPCAA